MQEKASKRVHRDAIKQDEEKVLNLADKKAEKWKKKNQEKREKVLKERADKAALKAEQKAEQEEYKSRHNQQEEPSPERSQDEEVDEAAIISPEQYNKGPGHSCGPNSAYACRLCEQPKMQKSRAVRQLSDIELTDESNFWNEADQAVIAVKNELTNQVEVIQGIIDSRKSELFQKIQNTVFNSFEFHCEWCPDATLYTELGLQKHRAYHKEWSKLLNAYPRMIKCSGSECTYCNNFLPKYLLTINHLIVCGICWKEEVNFRNAIINGNTFLQHLEWHSFHWEDAKSLGFTKTEWLTNIVMKGDGAIEGVPLAKMVMPNNLDAELQDSVKAILGVCPDIDDNKKAMNYLLSAWEREYMRVDNGPVSSSMNPNKRLPKLTKLDMYRFKSRVEKFSDQPRYQALVLRILDRRLETADQNKQIEANIKKRQLQQNELKQVHIISERAKYRHLLHLQQSIDFKPTLNLDILFARAPSFQFTDITKPSLQNKRFTTEVKRSILGIEQIPSDPNNNDDQYFKTLAKLSLQSNPDQVDSRREKIIAKMTAHVSTLESTDPVIEGSRQKKQLEDFAIKYLPPSPSKNLRSIKQSVFTPKDFTLDAELIEELNTDYWEVEDAEECSQLKMTFVSDSSARKSFAEDYRAAIEDDTLDQFIAASYTTGERLIKLDDNQTHGIMNLGESCGFSSVCQVLYRTSFRKIVRRYSRVISESNIQDLQIVPLFHNLFEAISKKLIFKQDLEYHAAELYSWMTSYSHDGSGQQFFARSKQLDTQELIANIIKCIIALPSTHAMYDYFAESEVENAKQLFRSVANVARDVHIEFRIRAYMGALCKCGNYYESAASCDNAVPIKLMQHTTQVVQVTSNGMLCGNRFEAKDNALENKSVKDAVKEQNLFLSDAPRGTRFHHIGHTFENLLTGFEGHSLCDACGTTTSQEHKFQLMLDRDTHLNGSMPSYMIFNLCKDDLNPHVQYIGFEAPLRMSMKLFNGNVAIGSLIASIQTQNETHITASCATDNSKKWHIYSDSNVTAYDTLYNGQNSAADSFPPRCQLFTRQLIYKIKDDETDLEKPAALEQDKDTQVVVESASSNKTGKTIKVQSKLTSAEQQKSSLPQTKQQGAFQQTTLSPLKQGLLQKKFLNTSKEQVQTHTVVKKISEARNLNIKKLSDPHQWMQSHRTQVETDLFEAAISLTAMGRAPPKQPAFIVVTGPRGSGKSSLISKVFLDKRQTMTKRAKTQSFHYIKKSISLIHRVSFLNQILDHLIVSQCTLTTEVEREQFFQKFAKASAKQRQDLMRSVGATKTNRIVKEGDLLAKICLLINIQDCDLKDLSDIEDQKRLKKLLAALPATNTFRALFITEAVGMKQDTAQNVLSFLGKCTWKQIHLEPYSELQVQEILFQRILGNDQFVDENVKKLFIHFLSFLNWYQVLKPKTLGNMTDSISLAQTMLKEDNGQQISAISLDNWFVQQSMEVPANWKNLSLSEKRVLSCLFDILKDPSIMDVTTDTITSIKAIVCTKNHLLQQVAKQIKVRNAGQQAAEAKRDLNSVLKKGVLVEVKAKLPQGEIQIIQFACTIFQLSKLVETDIDYESPSISSFLLASEMLKVLRQQCGLPQDFEAKPQEQSQAHVTLSVKSKSKDTRSNAQEILDAGKDAVMEMVSNRSIEKQTDSDDAVIEIVDQTQDVADDDISPASSIKDSEVDEELEGQNIEGDLEEDDNLGSENNSEAIDRDKSVTVVQNNGIYQIVEQVFKQPKVKNVQTEVLDQVMQQSEVKTHAQDDNEVDVLDQVLQQTVAKPQAKQAKTPAQDDNEVDVLDQVLKFKPQAKQAKTPAQTDNVDDDLDQAAQQTKANHQNPAKKSDKVLMLDQTPKTQKVEKRSQQKPSSIPVKQQVVGKGGREKQLTLIEKMNMPANEKKTKNGSAQKATVNMTKEKKSSDKAAANVTPKQVIHSDITPKQVIQSEANTATFNAQNRKTKSAIKTKLNY